MSGPANEVIELLERLPVTQGRRVGERLTVLPWQRRLIRGIVGSRTAAISVARSRVPPSLLGWPRYAFAVVVAAERNGRSQDDQ